MSDSIFGDEALVCRVCGCDEVTACIDEDGVPCTWVEDDLCSACADGSGGGQVQIYSEADASAYLRARAGGVE